MAVRRAKHSDTEVDIKNRSHRIQLAVNQLDDKRDQLLKVSQTDIANSIYDLLLFGEDKWHNKNKKDKNESFLNIYLLFNCIVRSF